MLVDAAPVTATFRHPFVVSALNAIPHEEALFKTVVAELTKTVVPALAYLRIIPSTFHAAQSVPSDAFSRATIVP